MIMFDRRITTPDVFEKLRPTQFARRNDAGAVIRDEVNALAAVARKHPAASGSTLAIVGLLGFGLGFLASQSCSTSAKPRKSIFKKRKSHWSSGLNRRNKSSFFTSAKHR